jgi:Protein of unknown function (DUF2568)
MGNHPLILALRFGLELAALAAYGYWGWQATDSPLRLLLAIGAPLLAALLWGALVSPKASIAAPGAVRLLVEIGIFAGAAGSLAAAGAHPQALTLIGLVAAHELARYDVIIAMLRRDAP